MGEREVRAVMHNVDWITAEEITKKTNRCVTATRQVLRSMLRWNQVEKKEIRSRTGSYKFLWRLK